MHVHLLSKLESKAESVGVQVPLSHLAETVVLVGYLDIAKRLSGFTWAVLTPVFGYFIPASRTAT